jgi:hypothetical protein
MVYLFVRVTQVVSVYKFGEICFFFLIELDFVIVYPIYMWEKYCNSAHMLLWIITVLFFFCFPKIIFINFIFLILSWLKI